MGFIGTLERSTKMMVCMTIMENTQAVVDVCPNRSAAAIIGAWQAMCGTVANATCTMLQTVGSPPSMIGNIVWACMLATHMKSIGRILQRVIVALQTSSKL